jgi:two-component system CheB/CheR fusion protein
MAKKKPADPQPEEQHDRLAQAVDQEEAPRLPFPVVGIGASAGGLEAFIEFFDAMPSESGMAFVLIQHLPPDRESMVADILSKHTRMPVAQVQDGMAVEADHVYVIQPGHTLTIKNGALHLGASLKEPGNNRPVDDFFRSLAEEQRERSICIIMAGMGSNGTAGAEVIKAVGGVAIAQDPESTKYPSMPRHLIDSGNADFILRPKEMPSTLLGYAAHPYVSGDVSQITPAERETRELTEILNVLRARTRRDFSGYKKGTLIRRIQRRMGLNRITNLKEYTNYLRQNAAEVSSLSDDLMIHVTGFFRDPHAWETLRQRVIEPLVKQREEDLPIRCWVTACSSGEEAYTLCMLLSEAAEAAGKSFDIKVFATDTADRTLNRARAGVYPMGIEGEITPARLERFFERDDATYRVRKELRELVVFAPQNVVQDPPFSRLDICTCRNLLIYLEPELQRRVLSLLHFGLREGGALFLGNSETISGVDDLFEVVDKRSRIYRRVGPVRPDTLELAFPLETSQRLGAPLMGPAKLTIGQLTTRCLLEQHTPAAVAVDRNQRVVYLHGDTAPFLSLPRGEPTRDLLPLVRENLRAAVRTALHKASLEDALATARGPVVEMNGGRYRVEITVMPLDNKFAQGHFLVTFRTTEELQRLVIPEAQAVSEDATQLHQELRRTQDELRNTIEELQAANEELKASNEEAMSVNEELQSTNEELLTSKEELQSLNEELTTVNIQLQTKMEEHEQTSNDLYSLLSSTDIGVVFLDTNMRIRRYTPAIASLIDLIPSDVGRPMSDLAPKFSDPDLLRDCHMVLDKLVPIEKEVTAVDSQVYVRRVLPYRTLDNRILGVVITFVQISERKRAQQALLESEQRFRLVAENAPDFAMLLTDPGGRIVTWNVGAERLLGWAEAEAVGKSAGIIFPPESAQTQFQQEMQRAAEFGRAADEGWHVRKSGARFWASGVLTAARDVHGKLTGFVKVLRDETARREAEMDRAELLERERIARQEAEKATSLKDQFLAMLSHELRTPIATILVWVRMLREKAVEESEREEGLSVIERSAEAQKQLLDDLLDTSRIASGKVRLNLEETDVPSVVRLAIEAIGPLAKSQGVTIEAELAPDVGMIVADSDRLRQVVGNLLNNAIKFTPSGGRVDVRLTKDEQWIELSVADTGKGIEPDFLPRVFTAFSQADASSTRSFGGLGLGLAISKELVELHGGIITAHSAGPGHGSTFVMKLPVDGSTRPAQRRRLSRALDAAQDALIEGVRILLVEDDPQTRDALQRLLSKNGAHVAAVATAADALKDFAESRSDIIISDIGLPEEDGYSLLQRIRSLEMERDQPPTPAIALTAFAGRKDRRMARESGFHKHIAKPVSPAVLLAAISTLLADKDLALGGA